MIAQQVYHRHAMKPIEDKAQLMELSTNICMCGWHQRLRLTTMSNQHLKVLTIRFLIIEYEPIGCPLSLYLIGDKKSGKWAVLLQGTLSEFFEQRKLFLSVLGFPLYS